MTEEHKEIRFPFQTGCHARIFFFEISVPSSLEDGNNLRTQTQVNIFTIVSKPPDYFTDDTSFHCS